MHPLHSFIEVVNSFHNLYRAVLNCIEKDSKAVHTISTVLGLTLNSTRHRLRNPQLWQLGEIEKIAECYQLPAIVCSRLRERMPVLVIYLNQTEQAQRRQFEKMSRLKTVQLIRRVQSVMLVTEVDSLRLALTSLFF